MNGSEAWGSSTLGNDPEAQSPGVSQQSSPKAAPLEMTTKGPALVTVLCSGDLYSLVLMCHEPAVQKREENKINTVRGKRKNGLTRYSHEHPAVTLLGAVATGRRIRGGSHLSPTWQIMATGDRGLEWTLLPFLTLNQHCPWQTDLNVFFSHFCRLTV